MTTPPRVSLAELLAAPIALTASEAAAVIVQVAHSPQTGRPRPIALEPSHVWLEGDGAVTLSPGLLPRLGEFASLLDLLVAPLGDDVPRPMRALIERAARPGQAASIPSLSAFAAALAPFQPPDPAAAVRDLVARLNQPGPVAMSQSAIPPVPVPAPLPVPAPRPVPPPVPASVLAVVPAVVPARAPLPSGRVPGATAAVPATPEPVRVAVSDEPEPRGWRPTRWHTSAAVAAAIVAAILGGSLARSQEAERTPAQASAGERAAPRWAEPELEIVPGYGDGAADAPPAAPAPAVPEQALPEPAGAEPAAAAPKPVEPSVPESAVPESPVSGSAVPGSAVSKAAVSESAVSNGAGAEVTGAEATAAEPAVAAPAPAAPVSASRTVEPAPGGANTPPPVPAPASTPAPAPGPARLIDRRDAQADAVYSPSFAPNGTAVFFHAESARGSALKRADAGGGELRVASIVDDGARNYHVQLSPDGTQVAFDSDRDGVRGVYVARADGRGVRRVSGPGYAAVPTWSPDGRQLAFIRAEPDRPAVWNLWLLDRESGRTERLTAFRRGQVWGGAWFGDGRRLAYSHEDRLTIDDLETGRRRTIPSPVAGRQVRTPAASPDGRWIVFQVFRDGVWLLEVETGAMRRVLDDPSAEEFAWAPDGRRVAYHSRRSGGWNLWTMTVPGA